MDTKYPPQQVKYFFCGAILATFGNKCIQCENVEKTSSLPSRLPTTKKERKNWEQIPDRGWTVPRKRQLHMRFDKSSRPRWSGAHLSLFHAQWEPILGPNQRVENMVWRRVFPRYLSCVQYDVFRPQCSHISWQSIIRAAAWRTVRRQNMSNG